MFKFILPLSAALAIGACSLPEPPQGASLPPDAVIGAGDPTRSAVSNTSSAFSSPRQLAGRPVQAAQAVAQMEFLAVDFPNNPRFSGVTPGLQQQMLTARGEWRGALGIAPGAEPQSVIDSLYAASRAMRGGQPDAAAAALPASIFAKGGQSTMLRLAAMPNLPLTNAAAVSASDTMSRQESQGRGRF